MRRRSLPLACAIAGFAATSAGLVGLASAAPDQPTASGVATCDGLVLEASGFDGDQRNRWLAVVNGVPYQGTFGASATKTIAVLPAAETGVVFWTAQVWAADRDPDATFEVNGSVGPCAKEAAPSTPAPTRSAEPSSQPSTAAPSTAPSSEAPTTTAPSPAPDSSPSATPDASPSTGGPGPGAGRTDSDGIGPGTSLPDTGAPSPTELVNGTSKATSVAALMIGLGLLVFSWVRWRRESA